MALIETSVENNCDYCVAAHSVIAEMQKLPADVIAGVRSRKPLSDPKLEALRRFTRVVVAERGRVGDAERQAFLDAGYGPEQVLDVITAVAMKTLSNYTDHLAAAPLDEACSAAAWSIDQAA